MRTFCVAVLLVTLLSLPLAADTHEVIKTTVAGRETIYAQYIQGKNLRIENLSQDGQQRPVTIQNSDQQMMYQLDLQSREYAEWRPEGTDLILLLAQWIARPPRTRESGKTVNIYYETIDTGERNEFFGRTAKHLLVRERYVAEPGACEYSHQIEKDGWYIPRAEPGTAKVSYSIVSYLAFVGANTCHDTVVKHGDPSPPGVPVLETDGRVTREILELSNDPLDKSLFGVPSGFKKVDALPGYRPMSWSQRLEMEWAQLERAFGSWLE
jgi:hypothetical protein